MQVVYTPAHLGHDITLETFMGQAIPANEVAERAEIIRRTLEADVVIAGQVGENPSGLAAGSGAVWVGDEDGIIRRVDEDTRLVTKIPFGAEIRALAFDDETDTLWVDVV